MRLGGVTINVKDLQKAKDFYTKLPGSVLKRDEPDLASFDFGGARVSLKQSDEPGYHLEMETDDVQKTSSQIEESGLQIAERKEDKFFVYDPDGTKIEVEKQKEDDLNHGGAFFNPERDEANAGLG